MKYGLSFDEFPVTVNSGREWIAWREVRSCAPMCRSRDTSGGMVGSAEHGQLRNRVHALAGARDFSLLANPAFSRMCTGDTLGGTAARAYADHSPPSI
jgi:hypothetical protein